jgi:hypothetical protein
MGIEKSDELVELDRCWVEGARIWLVVSRPAAKARLITTAVQDED